MNKKKVLADYEKIKEKRLKDRFFKHQTLVQLLSELPNSFKVAELGKSFLDRSLNLVTWGNGLTKIFLWSQMHGDEATGTMALFDLLNFLKSDDALVNILAEKCQLFILPMVNPDGAAAFTRRNAQQIDINRDFLQLATPEAKILKQCRDKINPHFGFNLHDQITLWSVSGSKKPATLSFLAPSADEALTITKSREKAMLVIADMFKKVSPYLHGQIGLFKDEYEPRAFGDNFQAAGTATILIEAGGYAADFEKQEIRKYYFNAMLSGIQSIAMRSYEQLQLRDYQSIPKNNKEIFHILLHDVLIHGTKVSIGINYEEFPHVDGNSTFKIFKIEDIGDLSFCDAYVSYSAKGCLVEGEFAIFKNADFQVIQGGKAILSFRNGEML